MAAYLSDETLDALTQAVRDVLKAHGTLMCLEAMRRALPSANPAEIRRALHMAINRELVLTSSGVDFER